MAQCTPDQLQTLLESVRRSGDIASGFTGLFGAETTSFLLGPPNAVDLHVSASEVSGERWGWRDGGWQRLPDQPQPDRFQNRNGRLIRNIDGLDTEMPLLYLDAWPAYEREPRDNLRGAAVPNAAM